MNQLTIPDKLYGRDRELLALRESFDRISSGHGEVLLVSGSSGAGKTALVSQTRASIRDRSGLFIRGKFEQYQQNVPYFAFRHALADLSRILLARDTRQGSRLRDDVLESIGDLGQVLVDLVPELEAFLGPQPPLGDISPQEARLRFADVLRNFLKVVCRPEHPLVIFIDDWQWADAASFELLRQLQVGITLRYLLVIVSYRHDEVDANHPLMAAIDDLRGRAVPVGVLRVEPLSIQDVTTLVTDTLTPSSGDLAGLAAFLHATTLGNPFFVRSFLSFLRASNRLWFDEAANSWRWRLDAADGEGLPRSVLELYIQQLQRLDADSQRLLALAACLGNRFDLDSLSIVSGRDPASCLPTLSSSQARAFVTPSGGDGENGDAEPRAVPRTYAFLHDRVQQAAYALIDPAAMPGTLLTIGRLLRRHLGSDQLEKRLFEVVNDLNAGHDRVHDRAERLDVIGLNITAARKAFAGTAYRSALQYFRAAGRFLEQPADSEHMWRDHHELTMRLFVERARCEFLEGDRNEAEALIRTAVAHSTNALERAEALNGLIVQYTLLARYPEAIEAGREALATLGIALPGDDFEEARNVEIALVRQELGDRPVSSLIDLPVMTDPEMLMAAKLLITMGPPCYRSHQRLWSVIVPKVVNLTLRHGNIPQAGYSHTAFGGLLGWVDGDYATAREFGELATRLMSETFRSPADRSVFHLMIGSSIRHWFEHLERGTRDYTAAYDVGLQSGNLQYAAYAFGHNMYCRFYQGVPLTALIQETQRSLEFSRVRLNQWAIDLLEGGLEVFATLEDERHAANGSGPWLEEEFLQRVSDHHNIQVHCIYKVLKTFSALLAGDHDGALALSDETEPLIYTVGTQGLLPWPEHVFARVLILTALHGRAEPGQRARWSAELDLMVGRLRDWAANCPENFEHKYLLASAELARIDGDPMEAMHLYDDAVASARAGNFVQWEGMANERAHGFWLECGNERLAHVYWKQAYGCYSRWGAGSKLLSMENAYRAYLARDIPDGAGSGKHAGARTREATTALVEKQLALLRREATHMERIGLDAASHMFELSHALERLKVEVAERRRAEEALERSQATLQAAMDQSPSGIAIADAPDGTLSYVNDAALRIRGGDRHSIVDGVGIARYVASWMLLDLDGTPLKPEEVPLARAVLYGETNSREFTVRRDDGDDRIVLANAAPIKDSSGKIVSGIVVFTDITDRKRTEEALRRTEGEFRFLAEAMPQIVWITRPDGWNVYFNHQWVDYTGLTLEESYGQGWIKPFHPDDTQRALDSWRAATREGARYSIESRLRSAGGTYRWFLVRAVPVLDERGDVIKWFGTCTDIHELKQAAESLRHRQKLESVGTLASGIAHDFNNLLGSMMGNLSLAQKQLPDGHPSAKYLELALSAAGRAGALTKQMLAYSGKGQFERMTLDVVKLVQDHLGIFEVSVPKNVRLQLNLPPAPVFVEGDPGQLEQILMNLIMNAGEAIGEKQGAVSVEVSRVSMRREELSRYETRTGSTLAEGTYALLTVTDSGAGMDRETVERIFDPFFSTKFIGRGLGLAAVLGIVRGHDGGLTVESQEGSGTTFRVLLPSVGAPVISEETPPIEPRPAGTEPATILIIDDEDYIVSMMSDVLELGSYRTLTATDPVIGVKLYEEQWRTIDLVILDYSMPKMNGKEVLIELRKINPEVRVILSSGYSDEELAHLMGDGRPLAVIQKPQTADEILSIVDRVLRMDSQAGK
ncbi:MAG: AAA family ATPase [Thermoanaerobaculia bacterium]